MSFAWDENASHFSDDSLFLGMHMDMRSMNGATSGTMNQFDERHGQEDVVVITTEPMQAQSTASVTPPTPPQGFRNDRSNYGMLPTVREVNPQAIPSGRNTPDEEEEEGITPTAEDDDKDEEEEDGDDVETVQVVPETSAGAYRYHPQQNRAYTRTNNNEFGKARAQMRGANERIKQDEGEDEDDDAATEIQDDASVQTVPQERQKGNLARLHDRPSIQQRNSENGEEIHEDFLGEFIDECLQNSVLERRLCRERSEKEKRKSEQRNSDGQEKRISEQGNSNEQENRKSEQENEGTRHQPQNKSLNRPDEDPDGTISKTGDNRDNGLHKFSQKVEPKDSVDLWRNTGVERMLTMRVNWEAMFEEIRHERSTQRRNTKNNELWQKFADFLESFYPKETFIFHPRTNSKIRLNGELCKKKYNAISRSAKDIFLNILDGKFEQVPNWVFNRKILFHFLGFPKSVPFPPNTKVKLSTAACTAIAIYVSKQILGGQPVPDFHFLSRTVSQQIVQATKSIRQQILRANQKPKEDTTDQWLSLINSLNPSCVHPPPSPASPEPFSASSTSEQLANEVTNTSPTAIQASQSCTEQDVSCQVTRSKSQSSSAQHQDSDERRNEETTTAVREAPSNHTNQINGCNSRGVTARRAVHSEKRYNLAGNRLAMEGFDDSARRFSGSQPVERRNNTLATLEQESARKNDASDQNSSAVNGRQPDGYHERSSTSRRDGRNQRTAVQVTEQANQDSEEFENGKGKRRKKRKKRQLEVESTTSTKVHRTLSTDGHFISAEDIEKIADQVDRHSDSTVTKSGSDEATSKEKYNDWEVYHSHGMYDRSEPLPSSTHRSYLVFESDPFSNLVVQSESSRSTYIPKKKPHLPVPENEQTQSSPERRLENILLHVMKEENLPDAEKEILNLAYLALFSPRYKPVILGAAKLACPDNHFMVLSSFVKEVSEKVSQLKLNYDKVSM